MQKMYYIIEWEGTYLVQSPNQLEKNDKIICYLPAVVWWDFERTHKPSHYKIKDLKKALEEYKVQWKKEHPHYEYYFE